MNAPKPLLLLDVDGPLNPYQQMTKNGYLEPKRHAGEAPYRYVKHLMSPDLWDETYELPALLSEEMGADLVALQDVFTLIWATTWEEEANKLISPLIGLPTAIPVIFWPHRDVRDAWTKSINHGGHWKTRHILRWLDDYGLYRTPRGPYARLPWVWVDDDIRRDDKDYVKQWYGSPPLAPPAGHHLMRIEPSHGLRPHDLRELREWGEHFASMMKV